MNEITNAIRVANVAVKTIKAMDFAKKAVVAGAVVACCCLALKFWRSI